MGLGFAFFRLMTNPLASLRYNFRKSDWSRKHEILFAAHRGASMQAPENSISAIRLALDSTVDMIEVDVHLSKDGEIVVIHDSNMKRTTNFDAEISDLTLGEIRHHFIINEKVDSNPLETVPTLDEVLDLVAGKKEVLIELKSGKNGLYPNFTSIVADCIGRRNAENWAILQSFEQEYVREIVASFPKIDCHQLIEGASVMFPFYYDTKLRWSYFVPIAGVKSVNLNYEFLSRWFVKRMHRRNLKVMAYTPNGKQSIGRTMGFGVDGVITDNASLVTSARKKVKTFSL